MKILLGAIVAGLVGYLIGGVVFAALFGIVAICIDVVLSMVFNTRCKYCKGTVKRSAIKCRHCGADIGVPVSYEG